MRTSNIAASAALAWALASGISFTSDKPGSFGDGVTYGGLTVAWLSIAAVQRKKENRDLKPKDKPNQSAQDRFDIM